MRIKSYNAGNIYKKVYLQSCVGMSGLRAGVYLVTAKSKEATDNIIALWESKNPI